MRTILPAILLICVSFISRAQEFSIPADPKLKTPEDYAALESTVIQAFDWLMKTPPGEQDDKKADVNAFLLKWMSGTPSVSIGLDPEIVTFMESSPDLLMIFMGGWTKHALESKDVSQATGNLYGVQAAIEYYTKYLQPSHKDKNMEKYVKMKTEGKLEAFIQKHASKG